LRDLPARWRGARRRRRGSPGDEGSMTIALRARTRLRALLIGAVLALVPAPGAQAHESRPAYLEITATAPGRCDNVWRIPVLSGTRLPVGLRLPDDVQNVTEPATHELSDSLVERRVITAGGDGLAGKRIEFPGLQATITDVLVRVRLRDGRQMTTLVHPSQPWIEVASSRGPLSVAAGY